ncbi:MAG: hypothetical protein AB1473_13500 [Thermodesulfobacteriota bacterium]
MTIRDIIEILGGRVLVNSGDLDAEVPRGGAADLMSDVLAFGTDGMVLMTGLTNPQVVRTADMAGVNVVVFVRDKTPPSETIEAAQESGITLISTGYTMYEACGRLFQSGLPGRGPVKIEDDFS